MANHGSLRQVTTQTGGPVGGAHRKPSAGTDRAWAVRGILVSALVLISLGSAAAALPDHGTACRTPASAQQQAGARTLGARYTPAGACGTGGKIGRSPRVYDVAPGMPWAY